MKRTPLRKTNYHRYAMSDTYCLKMRRQAVILYYGGHCFFCNETQGLTDHHIILRDNLVLRWDWRNGIPVCFHHHEYIQKAGQKPVFESGHFEFEQYLKERQKHSIHNICVQSGITQEEFMRDRIYDCLDVIEICMKGKK